MAKELDDTFKASWGLIIKVAGVLVAGTVAVMTFNNQMSAITTRMDSQSKQFEGYGADIKGLRSEVQGLRSDLDAQKYLQGAVQDLQQENREIRELIYKEMVKR